MKEVFIYCDGGFGNRFNAFTAGLVIARAGGFKPIVVWPKNYNCAAGFEQLIDIETPIEVFESEPDFFLQSQYKYEFVSHLNWWKDSQNIRFTHPNKFKSLDKLIDFIINSPKNSIVYNNCLLPKYIPIKLIKQYANDLTFTKRIIAESEKFVQENNLLPNFYGLHLRATDEQIKYQLNFDKMFEALSRQPNKLFFVCSDDEKLEKKFDRLGNVYVRKKKSYVEKANPKHSWRAVLSEDVSLGSKLDTHCENHNNYYRSAESVIEALIDLYILSQSIIFCKTHSTFLDVAIRLQYLRKHTGTNNVKNWLINVLGFNK